MPSDRKFPMLIPIVAVLALILGLGGLLVIRTAEKSRDTLPLLGSVPQFEGVNQDGTPFGLPSLQGKISVVDFMFTNCPGICPAMSGNMSKLYDSFASESRLQFISISVDPDRDTLAALQDYARGFGVNDSRWQFLWMPIDDVISLSENGFKLSAQNLPSGHSNRFVLVDQQGRIRGYYDGTDDTDMAKLSLDIPKLVKAL
jgi:protein SCO1